MTREDVHRLAELIAEEVFDDPETHEQCVWNMALKVAARKLYREALKHPWDAEQKA